MFAPTALLSLYCEPRKASHRGAVPPLPFLVLKRTITRSGDESEEIRSFAAPGRAYEEAKKVALELAVGGLRSTRENYVVIEVRRRGGPALHTFDLSAREIWPVEEPVSEKTTKVALRAHATAVSGQGKRK